MISKTAIRPDRVRSITGSFSWIDHRILSKGFLLAMSKHEILLYFFLVLVGDKNGVSFYSYDKICQFLKIIPDEFVRARDLLIKKSLIAFHQGLYQVLQIPESSPLFKNTIRGDTPKSLQEIFNELGTT